MEIRLEAPGEEHQEASVSGEEERSQNGPYVALTPAPGWGKELISLATLRRDEEAVVLFM